MTNPNDSARVGEGWTKGPWFLSEGLIVQAHDPEEPDVPWGVASASLGCGYPVCQDEANAHIIAAAPDLYEALVEMTAQFDADDDCIYQSSAMKKALAALARARGDAA